MISVTSASVRTEQSQPGRRGVLEVAQALGRSCNAPDGSQDHPHSMNIWLTKHLAPIIGEREMGLRQGTHPGADLSKPVPSTLLLPPGGWERVWDKGLEAQRAKVAASGEAAAGQEMRYCVA